MCLVLPLLVVVTYTVRMCSWKNKMECLFLLMQPWHLEPPQGIKLIRNRQLLRPDYLQKGDLDVTTGFPAMVPLITFVIGIFCNILGIGGGEIAHYRMLICMYLCMYVCMCLYTYWLQCLSVHYMWCSINTGELMGPFLLVLGFESQVSSATSSALSLLSSSSNVVHYGVDREIPWKIAAWIFPVAVVGEF